MCFVSVPLDRIDQNLNTKALCEVVDGETVKSKVLMSNAFNLYNS